MRSKLSIGGVALEPELVPRYLQALATEPALAGVRFNDFTIERPSHESSERGFVFKAQSDAVGAREGDSRS